jgi:hypothetical protein
MSISSFPIFPKKIITLSKMSREPRYNFCWEVRGGVLMERPSGVRFKDDSERRTLLDREDPGTKASVHQDEGKRKG